MRTSIIGLIMALMFAMTIFIADAANYYRVDCQSLNIRYSPSKSAYVIGKLSYGDEVTVEEVNGSWAKIRMEHDGSYGYVSTKYITDTGREVGGVFDSDVEDMDEEIESDMLSWVHSIIKFKSTYSKVWFYIALVLSLVMVALYWFVYSDGDRLESESVFAAAASVFFAACVSQIIYFITYMGDPTWFCSPDIVGWLWTVINFIIYSVIIFCQVMSLMLLVNYFHYHGYRQTGSEWGFYGVAVSLVAFVICGIFFDSLVKWVVVGLAITQVIQIVLWISSTSKNGHWGNLVLTVIFYLVCMTGTLIALGFYISLLIVVLIGLFVLMLIGKGGSASGTCGSCRSYSNGYCYYRRRYVSSSESCRKYQ